jgi:DNA polymerase III subunit delta'
LIVFLKKSNFFTKLQVFTTNNYLYPNISSKIPHKKMLFSEVIGQGRAKEFLLRLHKSERVPHAMIFLGNTGSGNLALGLAFAQLLQCDAPTESGACGDCNACRKAASFTHPDIHFSYPTVGGKEVSTNFLKQWRASLKENPYMDANTWINALGAENKQGNITADECNAIVKKLSLKIFEGKYKILLMWLPEYLGKEGNRLLKLIEEPPEQTIFILCAENQDMILNTVLSRCQLIKSDRLSDEEVSQALYEKRSMPLIRAQPISFLADGDFNLALQFADTPENDDAHLLLDWLRKCWKGNGIELVRWTEEFAKLGRENQKQFLQYGLHFLREMMSFVVSGQLQLRLPEKEVQTAMNMAKILNFDKITEVAAIFNDNIYYIERNANPKILFLDTSIRLHKIMKGY